MHHAVVMAGGGGTRLWPASRRRRPKQLLALGRDAGESLLAATCRRLEAVVGSERTWVVTAADQDVLGRALARAAAEDAIVTVGIPPTGPETGFGYLEPGPPAADGARAVA